MNNDIFVFGDVYIDNNYYCRHTSEKLRNYLGIVTQKKLTDSIEKQDLAGFISAVDRISLGETDFAQVDVSLHTTSNTVRKCRIRLSSAELPLIYLEIIDIENAINSSISNLELLYKFKFLFEREHRLFFEYSYENSSIEIFSYVDNRKTLISEDDPLNRLKDMIRHEITNKANGLEFDLIKVFSLDGTDYYVRGAAITRNGSLYRLFGTIGSRKEDSTPHNADADSHDAMTGLYNKPYALNLARQVIDKKKYTKVSLIMIDIDDFKVINDSFSHLFGDEVIKRLSIILRDASYGRGFAGRFGGDEFFICLYDIENEDALRIILQNILYHFKNSFPDKDYKFSLSLGIAEYPRNGEDFDRLLKKADRALYKAKFKGKDRYIIYKEEIHGELPDEEDNSTLTATDSKIRELQITSLHNAIPELVGITAAGDRSIARTNIVLRKIMDAFSIQGISIYAAPDFECVYRFGTYTNPIANASYMKNKDTLIYFNANGFFNGALKNQNVQFAEDFQPFLLAHGLEFSMQVIIGHFSDIKALVTFDREVDRGNISNEERDDLILLANILAKMFL